MVISWETTTKYLEILLGAFSLLILLLPLPLLDFGNVIVEHALPVLGPLHLLESFVVPVLPG